VDQGFRPTKGSSYMSVTSQTLSRHPLQPSSLTSRLL
jgi:hypothetical protein